MSRKLYKYIGPNLANLVLSAQGATFKCSLPKDFNDPYELFLTVDYATEADVLACYQEAIGALPQLPTTCFSKSPAVLPMWAHYAQNVTGFVIEIDEEELLEAYENCRIDDVAYQDEPNPGLTEMLHRVHVIKKPRYTYFLQAGTLNAAYFTKAVCWTYEQERRFVTERVREHEGLLLLDIPANCITSIIAGARADESLVQTLLGYSERYSCKLLRMNIGRSSIAPFFTDAAGPSYTFDGQSFVECTYSCEECKEPLPREGEKCSWCQITDQHRHEAAIGNPYRIMDRIGNLESYVASMDEITARHNNKRKDK